MSLPGPRVPGEAVEAVTSTRTASQSGVVQSASSVSVFETLLDPQERLSVRELTAVAPGSKPLPSGVDITIATMDGNGNASSETVVVSGDGSTRFLSEDPDDGEFVNDTGGVQYVGVVIDNGDFNAGSGASQGVVVEVGWVVE